MESELLQKLADKSISKKTLYETIAGNFELLPEVLSGRLFLITGDKVRLRQRPYGSQCQLPGETVSKDGYVRCSFGQQTQDSRLECNGNYRKPLFC